jgi:hypothetical protein
VAGGGWCGGGGLYSDLKHNVAKYTESQTKLILILIYMSTAIGLAPGGSTHLHAIHRTSQLTTKH